MSWALLSASDKYLTANFGTLLLAVNAQSEARQFQNLGKSIPALRKRNGNHHGAPELMALRDGSIKASPFVACTSILYRRPQSAGWLA
ncbi:hypothetical protein BU24DRAFT_426360 [Aaosphaeria arxii CBS 175.79]|uniref:Uncharacterized protein n=1 Tax=Aaosphaeria arxii CBS 175.79 TaxID=1450172 RepID=A0A6A5XE24_9PLEO|nr:uncharacterized protein BU24DRAFT_426360 [Aaosphaeria arxii CBS 175.79]KAF2011282.1 hypothetical protein BU24DRAFT_426360 [Aaosphaeria arxii CBS 175.79]